MENLRLLHATTFSARLLGLHAYPPLREHTGLCIAPCTGVHTFFLGDAIDVVFFDAQRRVLRTCHGLRPFRLAYCAAAAFVVELPAGYCAGRPDYAQAIRRALKMPQDEGSSVG